MYSAKRSGIASSTDGAHAASLPGTWLSSVAPEHEHEPDYAVTGTPTCEMRRTIEEISCPPSSLKAPHATILATPLSYSLHLPSSCSTSST
jgi:hypothetical protein